MICAGTWSILENAELTISFLLTNGEEWTILLRECIHRVIGAGAGDANTDLGAQIFAATWHGKARDTV